MTEQPQIPEHLKYDISKLKNRFDTIMRFPMKVETEEDARIFADAIRAHGRLQHVTIPGMSGIINEGVAPIIFSALAELKTLRSFAFEESIIGDEIVEPITQIIRNNPYLETLNIRQSRLSESGTTEVLDALKDKTYLRTLNISRNIAGAEGAKSLAAVIQNNPLLSEIRVAHCQIPDAGAEAISNALKHSHELCKFYISDNPLSAEQCEKLEQTLWESNPPNLTSFSTPKQDIPRELTARMDRNRKAIHAASRMLDEYYEAGDAETDREAIVEFDTMKAAQITQAYRHLSGLLQEAADEAVERFDEMMAETAPDFDAPMTLDSLTKRGYEHISTIEHPETWKKFDRVAEALEAQGTPITREFLEQKTPNGESYLGIGLIHAPQVVLPVLNEKGIHLTGADLIAADTKQPTALCNTLTKAGALQSLFTPGIWKQAGLDDMLNTYRALPDEGKAQIGNLQTLKYTLEKSDNRGLSR